MTLATGEPGLSLDKSRTHLQPLLGPSVILSPSILPLPGGSAGPMPEGCRLDASPRSTGGLSPTCDLSPPRPTFTSRCHSPSDVLLSETAAPAWFSPERLSCCGPLTFSAEPVGLPCDVEHFTRATLSARNPLCSVLKVRPDALTGTIHPFLGEVQTGVRVSPGDGCQLEPTLAYCASSSP